MEKELYEHITSLFLGILIIIFPLVCGPLGYENILAVKYYFFISIVFIYLFFMTGIFLYYLIIKKSKYYKTIKFSKWQICLLILILVNIISFLFSPYRSISLFYGAERKDGLFTLLMYSLMFVYLITFAKFNKKYVLLFSISSILVSFIAILQFMGLNPFALFKYYSGIHNMSFMTTIGNKDFISAFYTIMLPVSFCSLIFLKNNKLSTIIHYLSLVFGLFIFGIISVESGKVAFLVALAILLPIALLNNKRLSKFVFALSAFPLAYGINYFINQTYYYEYSKLMFNLNIDFYLLFFIIIFILMVILSWYIGKCNYEIKNSKKFLKTIYIAYPVILLLILIVIYFYDFNIEILGDLKSILHGNFSDELGNHRLFLWKRSLIIFKDYPIIGTGLSSFAPRFMNSFWLDILKIDGVLTINDTAANVYLTLLVNTGIIGLVSYLSFVSCVIKEGFKKKNVYNYVFLMAIITYLVSDFFNISIVITTPFLWVVMALLLLDKQTE